MIGKLSKLRQKSGERALLLIAGGFLIVILAGAILLSLPCAARSGRSIGFFDALFTSTSAVCVTGLVVRDTGATFSTFGRIALMCLIQIGGLGLMTFATLIVQLAGRQLSLNSRMVLRESMNESGVGGMGPLVKWVVGSTFAIELAGASVLCIRMIPRYGAARGVFYSIFHSVSAFCNAGFDLFGGGASLTGYRGDLLVNIAVMALIICGGLGFGVLRGIRDSFRGKRLSLNARIVLIAYGALFVFGAAFTLLTEWSNPDTIGKLPFGEKLLAAAFHSVTLRTAGFNTIDLSAIRPAGKLVDCVLMLIGASPASTGGGVKVTTAAVVVLAVLATVRGEEAIHVFRRGISPQLVRRALSVLMLAVTIWIVDSVAISLMQPELDLIDVLFECASAMGTVGVSAFGSANLCTGARILIILTMYMGRIGPLTAALALARRYAVRPDGIKYPEENVMIG